MLWYFLYGPSYYYEYRENIHLGVKWTPAFGSQTDVQHSFTYAVFIFPFNILVSRNPEFVSFFRAFYCSITVGIVWIVLIYLQICISSCKRFCDHTTCLYNVQHSCHLYVTQLLYYPLRIFQIGVSWESFTGVSVTANLRKLPGLSSVFWSILAVL